MIREADRIHSLGQRRSRRELHQCDVIVQSTRSVVTRVRDYSSNVKFLLCSLVGIPVMFANHDFVIGRVAAKGDTFFSEREKI